MGKPLTLVKAAGYLRMSDPRQDKSVGSQREEVEKYAADHGYEIAEWFVVEGVLGWKSIGRDGFLRLISAAESGEFDAVLCWSQDRFSRFEPLEANYYWFKLRRAGVHLATCCEGRVDWDDMAQHLVASVNQYSKSAYVKDMAKNVSRGLLRAAKRGEWVSGPPPRGYTVGDDRRLRIDPSGADLVRRIFRMYLDGRSLRGIAEELNAEGIQPLRSDSWSNASIRRILINRAYIGEYHYGDTTSAKFSPVKEAVVMLSHHPPIISDKDFEQVQNRLRDRANPRRRTPKQNGGDFILTGLACCGRCGTPLYGEDKSDGIIYRCPARNHRGKVVCRGVRIRQDEALAMIINRIESFFTAEEVVEELRADLLDYATANRKDHPFQVAPARPIGGGICL